MNSIGFPQAACLRKVAMVNGSKYGTPQPFSDCQEGLHLTARLTNGGAVVCFLASLVPIIHFVGALACGVARDRILDAKIYSSPSGANRCLTMRTSLTSFGAGIAEGYATGNGQNQYGNDRLPGGNYDALDQIATQSKAEKWLYRVDANASIQACFVPTVSSYALYSTNRNWGASLSGINIQAETPFKEIYAPDANQPHVLLTPDNVDFVRKQLLEANKDVQACTSGGGGSGCTLPTNACYTIKSEKSGKRIQAMGDNSVQQQTANGGNDQIWKVEDRGNGQVSFTVQDGTNRAIRTPSGANNYGEGLSLSGYSAGNNQEWKTECNPADANVRRVFFPDNNNTWDLQNFGDNPPLGIWGNTSEAFVNYRSFRFEAATCPGSGGGTSCNFAVSPSIADGNANRPCNQAVTLNANCAGSDCGGVSYSWSGNGINGTGSSVVFNVPGSNGSYTYTVTATKTGCSTQSGTVTLNVSGCGGGGDPCTAFTNGAQVGYRNIGDPNVKVVVAVRGACKYAVWSDGSEDVPRDWLPYITANPGFTISDISNCLKFNSEPCNGRLGVAEPTAADNGLDLRVAPNPSNGRFTVQFRTQPGQAATLQLSDLSGRAVRALQTIVGTGGDHAEAIVLPASIRGIVVIDVVSGAQRASQKILVE